MCRCGKNHRAILDEEICSNINDPHKGKMKNITFKIYNKWLQRGIDAHARAIELGLIAPDTPLPQNKGIAKIAARLNITLLAEVNA